jgi:GxxExxY protein
MNPALDLGRHQEEASQSHSLNMQASLLSARPILSILLILSKMPSRSTLSRIAKSSLPMEHVHLTEQIIACAFRVYRRLGYGFLESVYEKCLLIELRRAGLKAEAQQPIIVNYDGIAVGEFLADLVVEDTIILELKSVQMIALAHEVQLVNYLTATGMPVGLLLNFSEGGVQVRRKVRKLRSSTALDRKNPVNPVNPVKNAGRAPATP